MWRKAAITDAGGWKHDTITEDMDLSYRAQLAGWQFVYAPQASAPAELPCEMNSFKGQQYRWAKGSVQTARKLLLRILRAPVDRKVKTEAVFHLTNNLAYVFLLVLAALQLPNMLIRRQMEHPELLMLDVPLFLATCGSVAAFYLTAHHDLYGGRWKAIRRLPIMMALGIGLSINNGRAAIEGLFGRDVEFVRTPKRGAVDGVASSGAHGYSGRWPWHNTVELVFGIYCTTTLGVAIALRSWASVPFLLLFCAGFTYRADCTGTVDAFLAEPAVDVELTLRQHLTATYAKVLLFDGRAEANRGVDAGALIVGLARRAALAAYTNTAGLTLVVRAELLRARIGNALERAAVLVIGTVGILGAAREAGIIGAGAARAGEALLGLGTGRLEASQ
jgi:hypothetical protein